MVGVDAKALLAKYCLNVRLHLLTKISRRIKANFLSALASSFTLPFTIFFVFFLFFVFVFVTNYQIYWQLLMEGIFGYPLI